MAVVIEPTTPPSSPVFAHDEATAIALYSLGITEGAREGFTPLPDRLVQGIVALSGLITGIVWLVRLQGRG